MTDQNKDNQDFVELFEGCYNGPPIQPPETVLADRGHNGNPPVKPIVVAQQQKVVPAPPKKS